MNKVTIIYLVLFLAGCNETVDSYYSNYKKVVEDGAIERGWIPEWLPKFAYNIHESHDLDTNQSILYWKNESKWKKPSICSQIGPRKAPRSFIIKSWWPTDVPATKYATHRHVFFECGNNSYLAYEPNSNNEVYYWRVRSEQRSSLLLTR